MTQLIHPFLEPYHQVRLECGSPPHLCDAMTFYKLKKLECPLCGTPFTTSQVWQKVLNERQNLLQVTMKLHLSLFRLQNKLASENSPLLEDCGLVASVNAIIDEVNHYLDCFPFRGVPGLEFLARDSYNNETRNNYGYTVPSRGTLQVLEEFISENHFQKEQVRFIDYGTGTAIWSRFFLANGIEVLPVDCKRTRAMYARPEDSFLRELGREIYYVKENKCGLPKDCFKQILFLCWPEDPAATDYPMYAGRVLREFRERNGILAVYVGKERGNNTAAPDFFDEMEAHWDFTIVDKSREATLSPSDMYLLKKKQA